MNKVLLILSLVLVASCGPSQQEKEKIAAVTCSIMSETRNMDAAIRVREMNDAREKIGGEPFLRGDDEIQEAFEWGLCQELVLNEIYDETLQPLKDAKEERERIAKERERIARERERIARESRIADSKPTVEEELYPNGKLKSRTNRHPKNDGGEKHGLYESFYNNGKLKARINYKDGMLDGFSESYYLSGELMGQAKSCYKDGWPTVMSYCEK